ncbi:MAG: bifunctional 5,10-methylenetetrahydrofolate dehydrogenase/5,10-methenyltetrahydrofolate cyclohydrolase [Bacteroidetes bacterium]|nr:bifunctional 5,10-methylenetetrahydrofolate dehydrogenase/5,10-methenyltetrahydrofolate cyclohydrolase [Bacteroidota bacterium]MBL6964484.1 bifunctional 5,10-methylenetetrahydrofolate dehydrogenase/5,10-methenyltetrahydrofolate cyclohydrolase [Bacteroidota bacterium]
MILLDGKALSNLVKDELKIEVEKLKSKGIRPPHLAAILVGEDRASQSYVRGKMKSCERIGFGSSLFKYDEALTEKELLKKIEELNKDEEIDGFIVQLPLPSHIKENKVIEAVSPEKDVDGFHPINIGRMAKNMDALLPATPNGILEIIKHYKIETSGKHCVVVGRSNIVGMPMSILMGRKNYPGDCTVTLVHSRTRNIKEICQTADILIAAIGKAYFVTEDMVKEEAIVIDVGINALDDPSSEKGYKLVGDVDFDKLASKCSYITPVPGGVGAMTIASLLQNTMTAAKKRRM